MILAFQGLPMFTPSIAKDFCILSGGPRIAGGRTFAHEHQGWGGSVDVAL